MADMQKNKKPRKDDFLVQGAILAAAAVITKIIGVVYRIPLTNILGNEGNGFYGYAYEIYAMALMLSSFSLPIAVSKLVSARMAQRQRRNDLSCLFMCTRLCRNRRFVYFTGYFFGADAISTHMMKSPLSAYALKVLAPRAFYRGNTRSFAGYISRDFGTNGSHCHFADIRTDRSCGCQYCRSKYFA